MRSLSTALIILVLFVLGPGIPAQDAKPARDHKMKLLAVGESAPDWQLADVEGKTHSLAEYRGKVVVLDFWATWCGPCAEVMPRMQRLHEKYKEKGVVVLGVNSWERSDPVALMTKRRYSYGLLLKGEGIAESYNVMSLPVVYIIGVDGKVIYCHEGVDDKNLSSLIEKYFKGRAESTSISSSRKGQRL
jgi:thiol-disulfide isomerase/thioredoxin